jgi:NAD(P)-dependent dehydrogenase (short-subunit alcohol dehydrogenase family)
MYFRRGAQGLSVATIEREQPLRIEGSSVLVTGAGRGLGRALVKAFVEVGCRQVFATFRNSSSAEASGLLAHKAVKPVMLEVTSDESVAAAARACAEVDILVNNAGILAMAAALAAPDLGPSRLEMETNYWGILRMCRAFAPQLRASRQGAVVNILSLGALATLPALSTYCASKAAGWAVTQGLRAEFRPDGVRVAAVFAGGIATDMSPPEVDDRCPPDVMAANILQALGAGEVMIFPDPHSQNVLTLYDKAPFDLPKLFAASTI